MPSVRVNESFRLPIGFVFSQSSLQAYVDCPRGFELRYLARVLWPAIQGLPTVENEKRRREGRIFHTLVQQYRLGLPVEILEPLATEGNVSRWWRSYLAAELALDGYTQHVEFQLSAPVGPYRLLAKYDLLALKAGEVIIYDWKTSADRPDEEWLATRWQTLVYRALVILAGDQLNGNEPILPERITMIYWFPDFPSSPAALTYDAASYRRESAAIDDLVTKISSTKEFLPTDDASRCNFCAYSSYCGQDQKLHIRSRANSGLMSDLEPTLD